MLTFSTGGIPEILDYTCGCVVEKDNTDEMEKAIIRIMNEKPYTVQACLNRARKFEKKQKVTQYTDLYEGMQNE